MLISAVVLLIALTGCGGKTTNNAGNTANQGAGAATPAPSNVETLVKQNCTACHGNNLDGMGVQSKNLQNVGARLSRDQILTTISAGRGGMPAFKGRLKDDEIAAISDWLATKK